MSFSLESIRNSRRDIPERIVLHGIHKVGKTTFAAGCPGVIFLPTEDGQDAVDAATFPLCKSWNDVMSGIATLYTEEHEFRAVCLDSADWAEQLARAAVCDEHNKKGIGDFDYGKGYQYTADKFRQMLDGFNALRLERGMRIIVLAHTEIKRFEDPLSESYDRYQIKMHQSVSKVLQEWADIIGFAQVAATTKKDKKEFSKDGRTRAIDLDRRVLSLERSALYDAGNRYGMTGEVDLAWNTFDAALQAAKKGETHA